MFARLFGNQLWYGDFIDSIAGPVAIVTPTWSRSIKYSNRTHLLQGLFGSKPKERRINWFHRVFVCVLINSQISIIQTHWNVRFLYIVANTGGLLGLFMGFSMISISELFYFMTVRPYCNYLRISDERRRTFRKVFHKVRNLRFKRKSTLPTTTATTTTIAPQIPTPPSIASIKAIQHIDNIVYPYVD